MQPFSIGRVSEALTILRWRTLAAAGTRRRADSGSSRRFHSSSSDTDSRSRSRSLSHLFSWSSSPSSVWSSGSEEKALYFCLPFRGRLLECYEKNKEFAGGKENLLTVLAGLLNQLTPKKLLEYFAKSKDVAGGKENLLSALAGLFNQISSQEKQTGVIDTESFVQIAIANGFVKVPSVFETACAAAVAINGGSQLVVDAMSELHSQVQLMSSDAKLSLEEVLKQNLKSLGVDLDSLMDPSDEEERNLTDPYNFLNLVLNEVDEKMKKDSAATGHQVFKMPLIALLEDLQGIVADMRCAMCKTDKAKDQTVFTLSLDVAQHRSLAALLGDFNFNSWSIMHKLPCEKCGRDQDAEKRFVMKKAPRILIIHLKRFKDSGGDGLKKLSDEVSIPLSLQLWFKDRETLYLLSAIVFQTGVTLELSHYVCLVKSHDRWILFDDDKVKMTDVSALQSPFASGPRNYTSSEDAYILFYERTD